MHRTEVSRAASSLVSSLEASEASYELPRRNSRASMKKAGPASTSPAADHLHEPTYQPVHISDNKHQWKPGFFARLPYLGILALVLAVCCTRAAPWSDERIADPQF